MSIPPSETLPAIPERIILTGFMGSGKSTVGPLLAAHLGWTFLDLDAEIERRTGLSVPAHFAQHGESAFRREETAALAAALAHKHTVLALGGGAPETPANRALLDQSPATIVIYLAAPFSILAARCTEQATDPAATLRPVFLDPATAEQRFAIREPLYRRLAHQMIETQRLTPAAIAAAIASLITTQPERM